jgi:hypothetical protein
MMVKKTKLKMDMKLATRARKKKKDDDRYSPCKNINEKRKTLVVTQQTVHYIYAQCTLAHLSE